MVITLLVAVFVLLLVFAFTCKRKCAHATAASLSGSILVLGMFAFFAASPLTRDRKNTDGGLKPKSTDDGGLELMPSSQATPTRTIGDKRLRLSQALMKGSIKEVNDAMSFINDDKFDADRWMVQLENVLTEKQLTNAEKRKVKRLESKLKTEGKWWRPRQRRGLTGQEMAGEMNLGTLRLLNEFVIKKKQSAQK